MKKDEQELIPIAHLNERDIEFYAGITMHNKGRRFKKKAQSTTN